MTDDQNATPIPQLIAELATQVQQLVSIEIDLARAELTASGSSALSGPGQLRPKSR